MNGEKIMNINKSYNYVALRSLANMVKEGFLEEKVVNEAIRLVPKERFDFYINRDEYSNIRILDKNCVVNGRSYYKISHDHTIKYYTKLVTLSEIVTLLNKYPDLHMWVDRGTTYIGYID